MLTAALTDVTVSPGFTISTTFIVWAVVVYVLWRLLRSMLAVIVGAILLGIIAVPSYGAVQDLLSKAWVVGQDVWATLASHGLLPGS